jgi:hypothetical protein
MHDEAGDIWHEDEDRYWGGPLPKPGEGWTLAAATYDGVPQWQPGWEAIGEAVAALSRLQDVPDRQPDWDSFLKGLTHLRSLKDPAMGKPPLNSFGDFLLIGDFFLPFESLNEWGSRQLLFIIEDKPTITDSLLAEFGTLAMRLLKHLDATTRS